jgi:hypothetical protein
MRASCEEGSRQLRVRHAAARIAVGRSLIPTDLVPCAVCGAQKQPGDDVFVVPAKKNGKNIVMLPGALVGPVGVLVPGGHDLRLRPPS